MAEAGVGAAEGLASSSAMEAVGDLSSRVPRCGGMIHRHSSPSIAGLRNRAPVCHCMLSKKFVQLLGFQQHFAEQVGTGNVRHQFMFQFNLEGITNLMVPTVFMCANFNEGIHF